MLKFAQFISKALNEELLIEKRDDRMIAPKFTKKDVDNNRRIFVAIGDTIRRSIRKELNLPWDIERFKFVPYRGVKDNRYYRTDLVVDSRGSMTNTGIEIVIDSRVPSIAIYNYPTTSDKPLWRKDDFDRAVVRVGEQIVTLINKAGKCEGKKVNRGYYIKISQLDYDKLPKSNIKLIRGDSGLFAKVKSGRVDKYHTRFDSNWDDENTNYRTIQQWARGHKDRTNKFDTYKGWKVVADIAKQHDLAASTIQRGWGVRYHLEGGLVKSVDLVLTFALEINGWPQQFGVYNTDNRQYGIPFITTTFDQRKSIDNVEQMTIGDVWHSLKINQEKQSHDYPDEVKQAVKEINTAIKNVKVSDFGPVIVRVY